MRRVRVGYMRIKEFHGIVKMEIRPISREEALRILKGGEYASKNKTSNEK